MLDSIKRMNFFKTTIDQQNDQLMENIDIITCFNCKRLLDSSDLYCKTCGDSLEMGELE